MTAKMNEILHNLEKSVLKLEYGQKDIKSGQVTISKKLNQIEEALGELRELKESLAETKKCAAEQTTVMKDISKSLKDLKERAASNMKSSEKKKNSKKFQDLRDPFDRPNDLVYDSGKESTSTPTDNSGKFTTATIEKRCTQSKGGMMRSKSEFSNPECITDIAEREIIFDCRDDNMLHRYLKESAQLAEKRTRTASQDNRKRMNDCELYKEKFKPTTSKRAMGKLPKKITCKGDKYKKANVKQVPCDGEGKMKKKRSQSQGEQYEENNGRKLYGKYPCTYCNKIFCFSKNFSEHLKTCRGKHQTQKTSDDDYPAPPVKK